MTLDPTLMTAIRASLGTRTVSETDVEAWLASIEAEGHFSVAEEPLEELRGWTVDAQTGDLRHASGRFFTVQGVQASASVDGAEISWRQPVIVQTDVGVLGLVAVVRNGVLMVLVQAKMEPGNARLVQVSPTVQATASNFERVHEGSPTPYLELFGPPDDPPEGATFLVRRTQSEQGTRYLGKSNLNAIALVDPWAVSVDDPRFRWLTVGDLTALAGGRDLLHMDTRSILGSLPVDGTAVEDVDVADTLSWVAEQRARVRTSTEVIPLREVTGWTLSHGRVGGPAPSPFEVVGVRVSASSREVAAWDQPLVRNADGTEATLLVRGAGADLRVLVAAMTGVGVHGGVELGPSAVRWAPGETDVVVSDRDAVERMAATGDPVFDNLLPEEGGRFLHSSVRHRIVVVASAEEPAGARWLSLAELRTLGRQTSLLNMELRSLLACLPVDLRTAA